MSRPGDWRREERERRRRGEPSALTPKEKVHVDLPPRPVTLKLAVAVMFFQGAALLAGAGIYVYLGFAVAGSSVGSLVGLALMFLVMAAAMFGLANRLWKYRRWARPAAVAWNALLLFFAWSVRPSVVGGGGDYMFWGSLICGAAALVFIFLPPTLRSYDDALKRQDEANREAGE